MLNTAGNIQRKMSFLAVAFDHFDDEEWDAVGVFPDVVFVSFVVFDAVEQIGGEEVDHFEGLGTGQWRQFELFEIGEEGGVLDFDLASGADEVKVVFELFEGGDAGGSDAGDVVDEEGVFVAGGDLTEDLGHVFDGVFHDNFVELAVGLVEEFEDLLFVSAMEGEEHAGDGAFDGGHVADAEDFGGLKVIQEVGFADALGTGEEDVDLFLGQVVEFGQLPYPTDVEWGQAFLHGGQGNVWLGLWSGEETLFEPTE